MSQCLKINSHCTLKTVRTSGSEDGFWFVAEHPALVTVTWLGLKWLAALWFFEQSEVGTKRFHMVLIIWNWDIAHCCQIAGKNPLFCSKVVEKICFCGEN